MRPIPVGPTSTPVRRVVARAAARWVVLLTAVLAAVPTASAQDALGTVRGRVVSAETRAALPGARVAVRGGSQTTVADGRGEFEIRAAGNATLVVSMIGFEADEVAVGGRGSVEVALRPAAVALEELVVVGYTTQQRRNVTGAVASVQAEELEARKVVKVEEALKGRLPGVQIQTSGEPGQAAAIVIRGQNFLYNTSPLYVVDGLYMAQNPNLNPNDIESIQILKDASAASQYGAQAANGVVVISTKRGRAARNNRLSVRSYYGVQEMANRIEVMNAQEWAGFARSAYENARAQLPNADPVPAGVMAILNGTHSVDTDWQDAIVQRGAIQDHNLSMSGGTEGASYFISGGYTQQDGTIRKTDFERYSLRVNSELRRGRLTLGESLALTRANKNNLVLNEGSPLINAMRMPPGIPLLDPNNRPAYGYGSAFLPNFGTNPLGLIEQRDDNLQSNQAFGTVFGEYELLDGLRYRLNLGFSYNDLESRFFQKAGGLPRQNNPRDPAFMEVGRDDYTSRLLENLLTFDRDIGNHALNAVVGYTEQRDERDWLSAFRRNFADESLRQINAGTEQFNNQGFSVDTRLRSFLGRLNYALAERYLLTLSYRRDGSSRFGPGNRWGDFWSASAGWMVSEEPFFQSIPLLGAANFLKLRGSYGTLGNQDFADYQFAGLVVQNRSYLFGNEVVAPGAIQLDLANPNIKWQANRERNFGFDLGLIDNALTLTGDYYVRRSDDLLVRAPLPLSIGSGTAPFINAGAVENWGYELGLAHQHDAGDFEFRTNVSLATVRNRVLSLGNNAQPIFAGGVSRTAVGQPLGHFWVRKMDGIFQSDEEVRSHTTKLADGRTVVLQPGARPGDIRYADLNEDGLINDQDRYNAGNPFPDLEGGLFFDGRFRSFDFNLGLRGSYGNEIFNEVGWWMLRMDDNSNLPKGTQPWTPENRSTTTPRALIGGLAASNALRSSDRWVEDGSFLRLQNIQLGYTLPEGLLAGIGLQPQTARIYGNVQNVLTFTKYSGFDPEFIGFGQNSLYTLERGIDFGRVYPNPRTITFGIDLGL